MLNVQPDPQDLKESLTHAFQLSEEQNTGGSVAKLNAEEQQKSVMKIVKTYNPGYESICTVSFKTVSSPLFPTLLIASIWCFTDNFG